MRNLIYLLLLCFSFQSFSQPLLNDHELVGEYHIPKDCWNSTIHKCSSAKLTTSILSGKIHDKVQTTILYKLSGDVGKVGVQSWIKANKLVWLGWESVTSLSLDADHELYGAINFTYGDKFTFLPYGSLHMKSETVGSFGLVMYITKALKFGWEYRYKSKNELSEMVILAGMRIDDGVFNKIYDIIEKALPEKKEQEPNNAETSHIAAF